MTEHHCRWAGTSSPRLLRTHLTDCDTSSCDGCQPCPERHCRICGKEHVTLDGRGSDQTCGTCLAEARENLAKCWPSIELLEELLHRGPHSEAAHIAGPAADTTTWRIRHRTLVNAAIDAGERSPQAKALEAWIEDCRDEHHPLWVLGSWENLTRDHLDQPSTDRITGRAARAYLDQHLTRLAHDEEFPFEDLAADLRACATHIEVVAHTFPWVETGAPCIDCGRADLVKDYGPDEDQDRWTCPKCGQWWADHDYRAKVSATYLQHAAALTASQIAATYRVPEGTVRVWAHRGFVRVKGRDPQGRQLYDVSDVKARRDSVQPETKAGA